MHFPEPNTRMPLFSPVKETMVNRNPNAPIARVTRIGSDEYGFVVIRKMAP